MGAPLFDTSAADARDTITPLEQLGHADWATDLSPLMHTSDRAGEVKGLLDAFFLRNLPRRTQTRRRSRGSPRRWATRGPPTAVRPPPPSTSRLAPCCGSRCYFSHAPKVLMRRTRFLRALAATLMANEPPDFAATPPGHRDVPHFLRDAKLFLG